MEDAAWDVRQAVLAALSAIAEMGDLPSIEITSTCLLDHSGRVREAAVRCLAALVDQGDANAIAAVSQCLVDDDWRVRTATLEALPVVAFQGDIDVITAISGRLQEWREAIWLVRQKALEALGRLSFRGDGLVLSLVSGALEDAIKEVRHTALDVLVAVAGKDNADILAPLSKVMGADDEVRRSAIRSAARPPLYPQAEAMATASGRLGRKVQVAHCIPLF